MKEKTFSWTEVITKFDEFEAGFTKDPSNPKLIKFFEDFGATVANSGFDAKQLTQIKDRMQHLRGLFDLRKSELKAMSSAALAKHNQLNRYIKNANYKSTIK